ncbi:unnamed protein product [Trichogramma brassicae]|uniref:Uncharacterized protein n=1 Tax=Trichogramma brassicae TaxID=86971 RepID=A0A6H5IW41_9HYME|nr:unnamed protein product [Trichogramma brassicae]
MRIYIDVIHVTSRVIDANAIGQLLVRRCCAYTYGRIAAAVDGRYDQRESVWMCGVRVRMLLRDRASKVQARPACRGHCQGGRMAEGFSFDRSRFDGQSTSRASPFTTDGMCASELAFTERCEQILGGCEGEKVKHPQNFVVREKWIMSLALVNFLTESIRQALRAENKNIENYDKCVYLQMADRCSVAAPKPHFLCTKYRYSKKERTCLGRATTRYPTREYPCVALRTHPYQ